MHGNYAIVRITDNEVVNVIVADENYMPSEGHIKILISETVTASTGNVWNGASFQKSQKQKDEEIKQVRIERNRLLKESDWTQFPDSPLPEAKKQEWKVYRQALRDLPGTINENNMHNIVYPNKPE